MPRSRWAASAAAAVVLLLAGCGGTPPATDPLPSSAASFAALTCSVRVSDPNGLADALRTARAGDTVCLTGGRFAGQKVVVDRSGQPGRPIVVAGDAVRMASLVVTGAHIVVQGFVTVDGDGVVLSGQDLVARDNYVERAGQDGISCERDCADVLIEDNTVVRADGTGIIVEGQRITVRGNDISHSERRKADDADGIRFFGTGVQLVGNTVHDITDAGYTSDPPHTDCFQTYDNNRPPTVDAVISDNVCRNVDHQCLIATAEESGHSSAVGRSHGILFTRNDCQVGASQAVLVQWFPGVAVRDNRLGGAHLARGAIFLDGSTGGEFRADTVPAHVRPWEVDASSRPGFTSDVSH